MAVTVPPPTAPSPGPVRRLVDFYQGVMVELRKVTWPDFPQIRDATVKIIIFVLFLALLITLLDGVLRGLLVDLIPKLFLGRGA